MTSHTDGEAAHTLDSDLIDEPPAANTITHTRTNTYNGEVRTTQSSSQRLKQTTTAAGQLQRPSVVNLMTKKSKYEISPRDCPDPKCHSTQMGP